MISIAKERPRHRGKRTSTIPPSFPEAEDVAVVQSMTRDRKRDATAVGGWESEGGSAAVAEPPLIVVVQELYELSSTIECWEDEGGACLDGPHFRHPPRPRDGRR